ncbi:MAG: hypothetical protein ACO1RT_12095 [Planctomycetaceae bacterium]
MTEAFIVILAIAGGMLVLVKSRHNAVRRRSDAFLKREPVSDDPWTSMANEVDGSTVLAVVDLFATDLSVPKDRLYPSDRFDGELQLRGMFLIDEIVADELLSAVKDRFGDVEWNERWETVSDAVFGMAKQIETKQSNQVEKREASEIDRETER